jgi:hypothetical protein
MTTAFQSGGHQGGFGLATPAHAPYNNNAAPRRILFAKNDLKTEFVVGQFVRIARR